MAGSHYAHITNPDAFLRFFCWEKENTVGLSDLDSLKVRELVVSKDIISLSTNKPKSGAGVFEITLGSAIDFKSYISVGSWVFIHISDRPLSSKEDNVSSGGLKMVGVVKSVQRSEQVLPSGARAVRYRISGEDFHTIFNSQVYLNPILAAGAVGQGGALLNALAAGGTSQGLKLFVDKASPAEVVKRLIDVVIGDAAFVVDKSGNVSSGESITSFGRAGLPIAVPREVFKTITGGTKSGTLFSNMIARFIQSDLLGQNFVSVNPGNQFSLWSLIQQYGHLILNECYTELIPMKVGNQVRLMPSFVMRAIPFSSKSKPHSSCISFTDAKVTKIAPKTKDGTTDDKRKKQRDDQAVNVNSTKAKTFYVSKQIFEDEILSMQHGKSDAERFNFFYVIPNLLPNGDVGNQALAQVKYSFNSLGNKASLQRHGLRLFSAVSDYSLLNGSSKESTGTDMLAIVPKIVRDLWEKAYLYENGIVTLVGSYTHIPVGTNVVFADRGWMAHVEGVSHTYAVESEGKKEFYTTLTLVRLQTDKGEPISMSETREADGQLGKWDRGLAETIENKSGQALPKGRNVKKRIR